MDQTQLNWLTNFIWNIADDVLRDVYVRGKYRDVILPMTVLRRLDAVLEPTKAAVLGMKAALDKEGVTNQDDALRAASGQAFYNTSPFLLRDLKSRATQQKLKDDFEAYLDGFSPNVQDILNNFAFRNQIPKLYSPEQIDALVELYLGGADRDKLDPILDACVAVYVNDLDEDGQVSFKGKAKSFVRTYDFLATILPYGVKEWEKLSIFLNFLILKLPAPKEEDLSKGILEAIDMDSYRAEKKATMAIALPDADAEIEPVPTGGGGHKPEPEMDRLSNIIKAFNDQFGGLFGDPNTVQKRIIEVIPPKVLADERYQNAKKNSDRQNARIEHDKALKRVVTAMFKDDAQLFKQFQDNESFRRWLTDTMFGITYEK